MNAHRMLLLIARAAPLLVLLPAQSSAQVVELWRDAWTIDSESMATDEHRGGFTLAVSQQTTGVRAALAASHVREGRVQPGWTTVQLEVGPRLALGDRVRLGASMRTGGFYMDASNRNDVIEGCHFPCMFEGARGFAQGWSWMLGGGGHVQVELLERFSVMGRIGVAKLLSGGNRDETLPSWGVGVQYRVR